MSGEVNEEGRRSVSRMGDEKEQDTTQKETIHTGYLEYLLRPLQFSFIALGPQHLVLWVGRCVHDL